MASPTPSDPVPGASTLDKGAPTPTAPAPGRRLRVALVFPPNKRGKAEIDAFVTSTRVSNVMDLAVLDLDAPTSLADQIGDALGPATPLVDVLVHKLTSTYLEARSNPRPWAQVEALVAEHPDLVWMDPLPAALGPILSRRALTAGLQLVCPVPDTRVMTLCQALPETIWPVLVKRDEAMSTAAAHVMAVVKNAAGWRSLMESGPFAQNEVVVLQQVVPHDGVLFKCYVLGDHCHVVLRPSLDMEGVHDDFLVFDSQTIPKSFSVSVDKRNPVHAAFLHSGESARGRAAAQLESIRCDLSVLSRQIGEQLSLTLFGFDVIVDQHSGTRYVIDVNYFPSYQGVGDFADRFSALLRTAADRGWEREF
ncbi:Inositol-tetrakisphosphate 1-kinase [Allomyces arbusculus]|nr:Inositol-tetrakisphosphate 1-kinase [Allomyces arbusculus]